MKNTGTSRLVKGLLTGIVFGFLLQRGGATRYNVIIGQLLLEDFTVLKIMLSAVVVGMFGIYFLKGKDLVELSPKSGSFISTIGGGLIFGAGFALLGYCPGTAAGAVGQGNLDALIPGLTGMVVGSAIFAHFYPQLKPILKIGEFKKLTFPELLETDPWKVIIPLSIAITVFLIFVENAGL
ncbi:MAG: YeeE/YedE thiosulfate transporter family protein [Bacillota bacterium]